jgi:hypothetical protein
MYSDAFTLAGEFFKEAKRDFFTCTPQVTLSLEEINATGDERAYEEFQQQVQAVVEHHSKVAKYFEMNWQPSIAIQFTYAALEALELLPYPNVEARSHLWSLVLVHAVESKSWEEAYAGNSERF